MQDPAHRWQWDETEHVGTDYADPKEARAYDERMAAFRDVDADNARVLERLDLCVEDTVLEMGAGTGRFAIAAARVCAKVHACDVSEAMLTVARENAQAAGVRNVLFAQGGFLTYQHGAKQMDAVVTQFALHHLPDFWKAVALHRLGGMLRPGGKLYLADVVFSFPLTAHENELAAWPESLPRELRHNAYGHLSREFSTQAWIMEGILERAGFHIDWKEHADGFMTRYLTRKG